MTYEDRAFDSMRRAEAIFSSPGTIVPWQFLMAKAAIYALLTIGVSIREGHR